MNTVIGYKQNMTQTWDLEGTRLPVTVVLVPTHTVTQVKNITTDGYEATQVGIVENKAKKAKKTSKTNFKHYQEIKEVETTLASGTTFDLNTVLTAGDLVCVTGISKGRGFGGVMQRHGFKGGPKTHGQSDRARAPGSIGQGTTPGRVYKNKRMAGHYGVEQFTLKNLTVLKIDESTKQVWLSGPIPGAKNSLVTIKKIGTNKKFKGL